MKAINYTDIKRVYSNTPITLELVDGTTFKAYQFGIDCVECLEMAYEKISKRKGKTIDGVFVKEEDL